MEVTCSHSKNPALGWDIIASAKADKGENIARAQILLNGFSQYDQSFNPMISIWQKLLQQQGQYPGDNTVRVIVTDDQGQDTEAVDSWS